ncbi:protein toll [Lingula anatina]|uniref:Protein toll n=1 Tax=Lingula anatina TaxID=7574 RepID=A0A1S3JRM1_LINAN|nr:protein toll [Lingula anatina]XP_013412984.1 protein toll [Lingula anatina]XP_013412985.1 protein toll [Lingula anatina]XP_013412986.1 protein toll [Lingula anatina]XP_013412987.1 protein toll [Lingula anatina]XP_013412989.1 protein toll [Lingula anatina]XP_013412990.1 protein toll [Lingula anatina]|eukprot:XP_013412983.1 protein toll [Lingula anatina]
MSSIIPIAVIAVFLLLKIQSCAGVSHVSDNCPAGCECTGVEKTGWINQLSCAKLNIFNASIQDNRILQVDCRKSQNFHFFGDMFQPYVSTLVPLVSGLHLKFCSLRGIAPEALFSSLQTLILEAISDTELQDGILDELSQLNLEAVEIRSTGLQSLTRRILQGLKHIKSLTISRNPQLTSVQDHFLEGFYSLSSLSLTDNALVSITNHTLSGLRNLHILDLSWNRLRTIPGGIFRNLTSLTRVDLSHNFLSKIEDGTFEYRIDLLRLDLSHNLLAKVGDKEEHPFAWNQFLTYLDLSYNKYQRVQSGISNLQSLQYLDLSHNSISGFELGFQDSNSGMWVANALENMPSLHTLKLSHNQMTSIDFTFFHRLVDLPPALEGIDPDFAIGPSKGHVLTIYIGNNPMHCDCLLYDFLSFIQKNSHANDNLRFYYENSLKCHGPPSLNGTDLAVVDAKNLVCPVSDRNTACSTIYRRYDDATITNCSWQGLIHMSQKIDQNTTILDVSNNYLETIPDMSDTMYREVYLDNNSISTFPTSQVLPHNLTTLSLRYNSIRTISMRQIEKDLTVNDLYLGGNPWRCDCHARSIKHWLLNNSNIIRDLDDITCVSGELGTLGKSIKNVPDNNFGCPIEKADIAAIVGGLVGSFVVIIACMLLLYKCNLKVRIWLYYKFRFRFFSKSDKQDSDKIYDAFISYSSLDEKYVVQTLVPGLENQTPPFKVCVHYKHFIPGASIAESIVEAVENSKRTIMLLSQNFIHSEWCTYEFKTAHHQVLKDRSNHLIVVVLGDIPSDLDSDLKLYLSTNTYLRADDSWFWEKLLYAMPKLENGRERHGHGHNQEHCPASPGGTPDTPFITLQSSNSADITSSEQLLSTTQQQSSQSEGFSSCAESAPAITELSSELREISPC